VTLPPLLKWPGGKRELAPKIAEVFPDHFGKYLEPFAGGAALFFYLMPSTAILSDKNNDLMNLYEQVRDCPHALLECLAHLSNDQETYYQVRSSIPNTTIERAARLYYLMLLSFNGIYRVNLRGRFNVPYGHKTHLQVVDESRVLMASQALQRAEILCLDFESAARPAKSGDLVYFDPPYTVAHSHNGFLKYNEDIFSFEDQRRLARCASDLVRRGCFVAVSNAAHCSVSSLYSDFNIKEIRRTSKIAAKAQHRKEVTEHLYFLEG